MSALEEVKRVLSDLRSGNLPSDGDIGLLIRGFKSFRDIAIKRGYDGQDASSAAVLIDLEFEQMMERKRAA